MKSPRIVPDRDPVAVITHLVLDDFGKLGTAYRESEEHVDAETIVSNLISGEYQKPIRVVAFCIEEGWSRDVSEDLAREVTQRVSIDDLPDVTRGFVEEQLGMAALSKMPPEPSATGG